MQQLVAAVGRAVHVLTMRCVLSPPAGLEQRSAGTSSCREVSLQTAGRRGPSPGVAQGCSRKSKIQKLPSQSLSPVELEVLSGAWCVSEESAGRVLCERVPLLKPPGGGGCSSCAAPLLSYLLGKALLDICHLIPNVNPDYLQMGSNLPFICSFPLACQYSFLFFSPPCRANALLS